MVDSTISPLDGQSLKLSSFDYATLDAETRIVVQQRTGEIKSLMRRSAQDIIDIGQKLIEVKERLGHGYFGSWLESEFDWSHDTAQRFMRVADAFSEKPQIAFFAPSALYLLSAPSTPEPARQEAIQRAESGEAITHATAKQIVQKTLASTALGVSEPPALAVNAAGDVIEEARASGHVTLFDGEQVPVTPETLLDATHAAYEERAARQSQHIQENSVNNLAYKNSSESNEWYTPLYLIERARAFLREIDLDPASNETANQTIKAKQIYTIENDGLAQDWRGKVWCNPPYKDETAKFVDKMVREFAAARMDEGLLLVAARTDTAWFRQLRRFPRCFLWGRVKFINGDTGKIDDPAGFPSMVVYFGSRVAEFARAFDGLGDVYVFWRPS